MSNCLDWANKPRLMSIKGHGLLPTLAFKSSGTDPLRRQAVSDRLG
ncbi:hypothetical protein HMPREF1557_00037 [Streptococcus sobrinus W1703]|uniref:Uncharacterized protein n=1 Tax=Streptococcus sobrinus W1703 TaxID=1227275 RepID=U2KPL2_9STRE|nr:hypothetical protein HMPREF1557_00037 [Streptococcus sobrinus W1703]